MASRELRLLDLLDALMIALASLFLIACAPGAPRDLVVGEDACEYCRMTITDPRFGAQVELRTGKIQVFDSIDCLVSFVRGLDEEMLKGVWVADVATSTFVRADSATFLRGSAQRGPMGETVAYGTRAAAEDAQRVHGGDLLDWATVRADTMLHALTPLDRASRVSVSGDDRRYETIGAAVAAAPAGATIRVGAGTYREPTIRLARAGVTLEGVDGAVIDGEGARPLLIIAANNVTVRGLTFTNTGISHMEDRAAVRAIESADCVIADNRFEQTLFAVYLQRSTKCEVRDNVIRGGGAGEATNGNGVHLWNSPGTRVLRNRISGQRDGIYFEFSKGAVAIGNESRNNSRYGLHFMFSDSCRYEGNQFVANGAGAAVMYSKGVSIVDNAFRDAVGSSAYALLLKDITDGELTGNEFTGSSSGLYLEGASRLEIRDNDFRGNGWAVRLMADALDNRFTGNRFADNAFDVATNSRTVRSTFEGNWWDNYRGYDLDRDGHGDVPFRPVRFFALVVERHPEALLLLRAPVTSVLDAAERVFPVLTPEVADARPLMRRL